jgi:hypothetical protein
MLAGWVGLGFSVGAWPGRNRALLAARTGDWLFVGAMVLAAGVFGTADLGAMKTMAHALPLGGASSSAATAAAVLLVAAIVARVVQVPLDLGATPRGRRSSGLWLSVGVVLAAGGYVVLRNVALFHQVTAQ